MHVGVVPPSLYMVCIGIGTSLKVGQLHTTQLVQELSQVYNLNRPVCYQIPCIAIQSCLDAEMLKTYITVSLPNILNAKKIWDRFVTKFPKLLRLNRASYMKWWSVKGQKDVVLSRENPFYHLENV